MRIRSRRQPGLLNQIHGVIRRLHYNYSIHTEQANVDWIRRFILYLIKAGLLPVRFILFHGKRHPVEMGGPEGTVSPCSRIGSAGPPVLPGVFTSP